MEDFPLLSDEQLEHKHIFGSLEEALGNTDECYQLELTEGVETEEDLASALPRLGRLQTLIFTDNQRVKQFPHELAHLKNLQYLEIRECAIEAFPEDMDKLHHITDFIVSDCPRLRIFPEFIFKWTGLQYLEIAGTGIMGIPAGIGNLTELEDLNINQNQLHDLPKDLAKLHKLNTLRTYGNYAMYLDAKVFMQLKALETFDHGLIQFQGATIQEVQAALPNAVFTQVSKNDPVYRG